MDAKKIICHAGGPAKLSLPRLTLTPSFFQPTSRDARLAQEHKTEEGRPAMNLASWAINLPAPYHPIHYAGTIAVGGSLHVYSAAERLAGLDSMPAIIEAIDASIESFSQRALAIDGILTADGK